MAKSKSKSPLDEPAKLKSTIIRHYRGVVKTGEPAGQIRRFKHHSLTPKYSRRVIETLNLVRKVNRAYGLTNKAKLSGENKLGRK